MAPKKLNTLEGKWDGKLLDITGANAILELALRDSKGDLSGDFSVSFLPPEDSGCCGPMRRLAQSGPVSGKFDSKTGRVRLSYEVTVNLVPISVAFEGSISEADPHARCALVGLYEVSKGADSLTLVGGACVLWLFAGAQGVR